MENGRGNLQPERRRSVYTVVGRRQGSHRISQKVLPLGIRGPRPSACIISIKFVSITFAPAGQNRKSRVARMMVQRSCSEEPKGGARVQR